MLSSLGVLLPAAGEDALTELTGTTSPRPVASEPRSQDERRVPLLWAEAD